MSCKHITDGTECWCGPTRDPGASPVAIIHNEHKSPKPEDDMAKKTKGKGGKRGC